MNFLPKPQILRCYFENAVQTNIPAMHLRWDPDAPGVAERVWHLPGGVSVNGPAPEYFGVTIQRQGSDGYRVRLLWNQLHLSWQNLTRLQIMTSALAPVLRSLGTDLWHLLEQPIEKEAQVA